MSSTIQRTLSETPILCFSFCVKKKSFLANRSFLVTVTPPLLNLCYINKKFKNDQTKENPKNIKQRIGKSSLVCLINLLYVNIHAEIDGFQTT